MRNIKTKTSVISTVSELDICELENVSGGALNPGFLIKSDRNKKKRISIKIPSFNEMYEEWKKKLRVIKPI